MEQHREYGPMYLVSTPEHCCGTVLGAISSHGGFIEAMSGEGNERRTIHARIPDAQIVQFEAWLYTTAGVEGRVTAAQPSNDHDV